MTKDEIINSDLSQTEAAEKLFECGYALNVEAARSSVRRARAKQQLVVSTPDRTLSRDAIEFLPNDLIIKRDLSNEELTQVLRFLTLSHDASLFWYGKLLSYIKAKKREDYLADLTYDERRDPDMVKATDHAARTYVTVIAGDSNDALTVLEAMDVCDTLGSSRFNLSWRHHREAVAECGAKNGAGAVKWLKLAEQNKWTPSEMRVHIRRSKADEGDRTHEPRSLTITTELRKLALRIKSVLNERPVESWSLDEVSAFLDDSEDFASLWLHAKQRWAHFNPEIPGL